MVDYAKWDNLPSSDDEKETPAQSMAKKAQDKMGQQLLEAYQKDPSKVDRSAAYAARYLAKNVVAAGLAQRCTIQLAYAIGVAEPLSLYVDFHGTGNTEEAKVARALRHVMKLTPRGIREHLGLNRPIYARTSAYGHFGREPDADGGFSWERTDLVDQLKALA